MALADTAKLIASLELQDKFSRPAAGITRSLGGMERGFSQIGRGAGQVAGGLATLGTRAALVATGGLAAVVKTAIDFEDAFAGVRKTIEATPAEFDELFSNFRQMARETGIAFEEFSRIGQIAGALGVQTKAIDEFSLAIAQASTATGLTVDSLADSVGRVGNILKLDESTYATFLSTLVELGNKGASTEAEILDIATRFAATGKQAGLTTDEILGLSSAISSLGVQPEAAGSSLSRLMSNFITETANGTDKAKEFARVAGTSFTEFADIVEQDTLGAVLKFVAGLDGLDKLEKFKALKEAGITNVRDRQAILAFADGIGEVNRQLGVAQDEFGKTNALTEEFRKRQETVARQLAIVKENVRDAAFTIGEQLLPTIKGLTTEFVAFLNLDTTQTGIKTFAKDLASGIRGLITELKGTDFSGIIDGMKLAATVAKGAFDAFRSLPQPIQQLAIAALVANKVSGGAIGQIAGGLGNIIGGTIKLAFPKLDIFSRGSPLNPMFVSVIGGVPTGGAPSVAGKTGGGLLAGAAKFVLGPAAAVIIGAEIAAAVNEKVIGPARDFEERQFQAVVDSKDLSRIVGGLEAIERGQNDPRILEQTALIASNIPFIGDALGHVGPKLEEQKQVLLDQLQEMGLTRQQAEQIVAHQEQVNAKVEQGNQYALTLNGIVRASHATQRQIVQRTDATRLATERGFAKTAALEREIVGHSRTTATKAGQTATNTASYLAKAERALGIAQEQTGVQRGILAKRSSFTVNNSISVPVSVNASLVQERIFQINHSYGSGSGPGGAVLDI